MKISSDVKEFLEHAGKVLVMENEQPKYVVAKFSEYMDLVKRSGKTASLSQNKTIQDQEILFKHENPYIRNIAGNQVSQEVSELNQELEAIAAEDLFSPLPPEEPVQSRSSQFYRELE